MLLNLAPTVFPRVAHAEAVDYTVYVHGTTCPTRQVWVDVPNDPDPYHHYCQIPVAGSGGGGSGASESDGDPRNGDDLPPPNFSISAISAQLACEIEKYSRIQGSASDLTMKSAWAYGDPGFGDATNKSAKLHFFDHRLTNTTLVEVAGITYLAPDGSPVGDSWLFNAAYTPLEQISGWIPRLTPVTTIRDLTSQETALLTAIHELAHRIGEREAAAIYYGILAVKNRRHDSNGEGCR